MGLVGDQVLVAHMPRTGGRTVGRVLTMAGVASLCTQGVNHEPLSELVQRFGRRRMMVGTVRDPAAWFAAMAVSSVQCHPDWIAPYLQATGITSYRSAVNATGVSWEDWAAACPWPRLIAAMVDPSQYRLEPITDPHPDADILRPISGLSLYGANYVRLFCRPVPRGMPRNEIIESHDHMFKPTHILCLERIGSGVPALLAELGVDQAPVVGRVREDTPSLPFEQVYSGQEGAAVLRKIEAWTSWVRGRYYDRTDPIVRAA